MAIETTRAVHGTRSRYVNGPCHCDRCRSANADYQVGARRERRLRLLAGLASPTHGKHSTYVNWGCHCPACTKANSEASHPRGTGPVCDG